MAKAYVYFLKAGGLELEDQFPYASVENHHNI